MRCVTTFVAHTESVVENRCHLSGHVANRSAFRLLSISWWTPSKNCKTWCWRSFLLSKWGRLQNAINIIISQACMDGERLLDRPIASPPTTSPTARTKAQLLQLVCYTWSDLTAMTAFEWNEDRLLSHCEVVAHSIRCGNGHFSEPACRPDQAAEWGARTERCQTVCHSSLSNETSAVQCHKWKLIL